MMKPEDLRDLSLSFQKSRIFLTAFELGIFTAVGKDSMTSCAVADKLGTARRHTDRLMNALCAIGLLKKAGDRFRNTPFSSKYLVSKSPYFMHGDRKSTRLNSSHSAKSRMPSSA